MITSSNNCQTSRNPIRGFPDISWILSVFIRALSAFILSILVSQPLIAHDSVIHICDWQLSVDSESEKTPITLPAYLGRYLTDETPSFSLTSSLELPTGWRGKTIVLSIPDTTTIVNLSINGISVPLLSQKQLTGYRSSGPKAWRISPDLTEGHTLHLTLIFQHQWPYSALIPVSIRLNKGLFGDSVFSFYTTFRNQACFLGATWMLFIVVFYFISYIFNRDQTIYLLVGIQFLGAGVYLLFLLGVTQHILGIMDIPVMMAMICFAIVAGTAVTRRFIYQKKTPGAVFLVPLVLGIGACFMGTPFQMLRSPFFLAVLAMIYGGIIYNIAILGRLSLQKHKNAFSFFLAWLILGITCTPDIARYAIIFLPQLSAISAVEVSYIGFVVFSITQMVKLGQDHYSFYKQSVALSKTLQYKSDELEQKNIALMRLDKLKDEFLANTSHELKTPLNGIIGLADSLLAGVSGKLPAKAEANLSLIVSSGKRLSNLINDVLDFSRLENNDLQLQCAPLDVKSAVHTVLSVLAQMAEQKNLVLEADISEPIPFVFADENRVQQILYNLVGNALKFSSQGSIRVSAGEKNGMVTISVIDNGPGVPESMFEQIFRSFERYELPNATVSEGTGLGLSIAKKLVELHGGTIGVKSTVGLGATFYFTLPVTEQPPGDLPRTISNPLISGFLEFPDQRQDAPLTDLSGPEASCQSDMPKIQVLAIDDEPINLQVVTDYLSLNGISCMTLNNGREALKRLKQGLRPEILLLDIMMPEMSGYEVCRRIRENFSSSKLPIIMMTAKNRISDLVEGFSCGANDYLVKPHTKEELLARIRTHLAIKRSYETLEENHGLRLEIELRKQTEQELKKTQRQLSLMLDKMEDALLAINENREISFCNTVFENVFGIKADDILGLPYTNLFPENNRKSLQKIRGHLSEEQLKSGITIQIPNVAVQTDSANWEGDLYVTPLELEDETFYIAQARQPITISLTDTSSRTPISPIELKDVIRSNRDRIRSFENSLAQLEPEFKFRYPEIVNDLNAIDGFLENISEEMTHESNSSSFRADIVNLMNQTIHCWVESTGLTKADLAEQSNIWKVYIDHNGWRRTQTLDKYLKIDTLPKRPRLTQVLQSAYYVLNNFQTQSPQQKALETVLERVKTYKHGNAYQA